MEEERITLRLMTSSYGSEATPRNKVCVLKHGRQYMTGFCRLLSWCVTKNSLTNYIPQHTIFIVTDVGGRGDRGLEKTT
jgi:hypothetical protein